MTTESAVKTLEVWTLQNLLNLSIMLGLLATGLALIQAYYRSLEKQLTLRVSIELWRVLTVVAVDACLTLAVVIGYLLLNPDIMSDIKMAIPLCPIATLFFTAALIVRLFHGGHDVESPNYLRALCLMFAGSLMHVIGFTFVMEGPGDEWMEKYPSEFWTFLRDICARTTISRASTGRSGRSTSACRSCWRCGRGCRRGPAAYLRLAKEVEQSRWGDSAANGFSCEGSSPWPGGGN